MENSMNKLYYQVYYPEMEDEYIQTTVEFELPDTVEPSDLSNAIDFAMGIIESDAEHDDEDRLTKTDAILNEVCKHLGGSWHYLSITGVLEVE
jgi:hypothetical protein